MKRRLHHHFQWEKSHSSRGRAGQRSCRARAGRSVMILSRAQRGTRCCPCQTLSWSPLPGRAGPEQNLTPHDEPVQSPARRSSASRNDGARRQGWVPGTSAPGIGPGAALGARAVGDRGRSPAVSSRPARASRCLTCSLRASEPDTITDFNSFAGVGLAALRSYSARRLMTQRWRCSCWPVSVREDCAR